MGFLISNELKKLIGRRRFTVTLIMLSIVVALTTFGTDKNTKKENIQSKIAMAENQAEYYNQKKKVAEENKYKDAIYHYKIQMKVAQTELDSFKKLGDKSTSWKEKLKTDIASSEELKRAPIVSSLDTEIENQNKNILIKQYYLKNNIEYDYMKTNQIFKVFPMFFNYVGRLLLFVVIVLLASDIVSGENNPSIIKMLLTKPITRGKILFSKFITVFISIVVAMNIRAFAIPGAPTMTNKILPFIFACYYDVSFVVQGDMAERIINPLVNLHFAQFISLG